MLPGRLAASKASLAAILVVVLGASEVYSQEYPVRPIRIVTSAPGGGRDFVARLIAQGISDRLGKRVIVDNRGGAVLMAEIVSNATPDGYTFLIAASTLWIGPLLQKMPYDVDRDFAPVTFTDKSPGIMAVHPTLPVPIKSVREFIALAKARPGQLNYSSSAPGSSSHLAAELFKMMAGVDLVRVSYKGSGPSVLAVMQGEVQVIINTGSSIEPHARSGRLRALAVTSLDPSRLFPDLPTVAASGVPGYEFVTSGIMVAPAKTPAAVIRRVNQEVVRYLNTSEAKEKFLVQGVEPYGSSPKELDRVLKAERAMWAKVIKHAGIVAK